MDAVEAKHEGRGKGRSKSRTTPPAGLKQKENVSDVTHVVPILLEKYFVNYFLRLCKK